MRKSISHYVPKASTINCTRHLIDNARHYLTDKIGVPSAQREKYLKEIFSDDKGLASCNDVVIFDNAVDNFRRQTLTTTATKFVQYFDRVLLPMLRDNVVAGPADWTNNNCESLNHVLKCYVQWKPQQLSELIDKLQELVEAQYRDADRALCGLGNFVLMPD